MSHPDNPFTPSKKPGATVSRGALTAWSLTAVLAMAIVILMIRWSQSERRQQEELANLGRTLDQTAGQLSLARLELETNQVVLTSLKQQVAELKRVTELAANQAARLEEEMRVKLESKDVTIAQLQGKLTLTILDQVMFDSGEATLKRDGAAVMQKIASWLVAHPELRIHVNGHTDNVPIRPTAQSRFASNWELSTARALAAVHFLTENGGVDPHRVGAVGYGEFRPIADNTTAEGRAKNRRITITILPEELAAEDHRPVADNNASGNASSALKN